MAISDLNNPDADPEMSLNDVLRQTAENAKLFSSDELTRHIQNKHFSAGVPLLSLLDHQPVVPLAGQYAVDIEPVRSRGNVFVV